MEFGFLIASVTLSLLVHRSEKPGEDARPTTTSRG
jgi:hypothetical protein